MKMSDYARMLGYMTAEGYELGGLRVSRDAVERAYDYAMAMVGSCQRRAKGLHYGKPRRMAIQAEESRWWELTDELYAVLFGHCTEWEPYGYRTPAEL